MTTDNPFNFIPHDRMSKNSGTPNKELIRYNARRYQLNQIAIRHEIMSLGSVEQLTNWYHVGRVISRLQRIHMGVAVDSPHWSSLIQVKESK